jgi:hypothetical protein
MAAAILATLITDPLESRFDALAKERMRPVRRSVRVFDVRRL